MVKVMVLGILSCRGSNTRNLDRTIHILRIAPSCTAPYTSVLSSKRNRLGNSRFNNLF